MGRAERAHSIMDTAVPNAAGAPQPSKLGAVVLALLINAVPLIGVLYFEWSAINVLVLYWFENLMIGFCTLIRLVLHRRWTRKRGYWRHSNRLGIQVNNKPAEMGLIGEYATGTFGFTLGHGIFVGAIVLIVHQNYPDQPMWQLSWNQVLRGALAIAGFLGIELAVDLTRIRGASFAAMTSTPRCSRCCRWCTLTSIAATTPRRCVRSRRRAARSTGFSTT